MPDFPAHITIHTPARHPVQVVLFEDGSVVEPGTSTANEGHVGGGRSSGAV